MGADKAILMSTYNMPLDEMVADKAILMSTYNMPLSIYKKNSPEIIPNTIMSAAMDFFLGGDSRKSLK